MPKWWWSNFEWTKTHIRVADSPETWFASAKTARKDEAEALAGVHWEHVLIIADEASGIPDEVFEVMEGALTESNYIVILIRNPTRLEGYFYETFQSKKRQNFTFSSVDSPLVTDEYVEWWKEKYWDNSDEYRVRVLWKFPTENVMDSKWYVRLIHADKINYTDDKSIWAGKKVLGIDPAGTGRDNTRWIVRDSGKSTVVAEEKISNPKGIAQKTATLCLDLWVDYWKFSAGRPQSTPPD